MNKNDVSYRLRMIKGDAKDEDFAEECGVPLPTIRAYLTRKRFPTHENLQKIADAKNVPYGWLAGGQLQKIDDIDDSQVAELLIDEPEVIGINKDNVFPFPIVKTYDDLKNHLQFFCIHCNCWHYHGRGSEEKPYEEGEGGMAGHRIAHCFTMNSPYRKHGISLFVVDKLKSVKNKYKNGKALICPKCHNYYSAAYNACSCGYINTSRKNVHDKLASLYQQISTGVGRQAERIQVMSPLDIPRGSTTHDEEEANFNQELDRLFTMVKRWQSEENGQDSMTSMQFVKLFHERIPELAAWIKKRKGGDNPSTVPEQLSVNENK